MQATLFKTRLLWTKLHNASSSHYISVIFKTLQIWNVKATKNLNELTLFQPHRMFDSPVILGVVGRRRIDRIEKWPDKRLVRVARQLAENAIALLQFVTKRQFRMSFRLLFLWLRLQRWRHNDRWSVWWWCRTSWNNKNKHQLVISNIKELPRTGQWYWCRDWSFISQPTTLSSSTSALLLWALYSLGKSSLKLPIIYLLSNRISKAQLNRGLTLCFGPDNQRKMSPKKCP